MRFIDDIAKKNHANWNKDGWLVDSPGTKPVLGLEKEPFRGICGWQVRHPARSVHVGIGEPACAERGRERRSLSRGRRRPAVGDVQPSRRESDRAGHIRSPACQRPTRGRSSTAIRLSLVHGDMQDLSKFADGSFDCVCQPISICFVPDVRVVYREVARVLKPGGLYQVAFCNPATYPRLLRRPE